MKFFWMVLFLAAAPIDLGFAQQPDPRIDRIEQRVKAIEENTAAERNGIDRLEDKVSALENRVSSPALDEGGLAFVCGLICAYWAQNTRRNAWLWFFLGMFGTVFAFLALLYKNSNDIRERDDTERRRRMFPGSTKT